MTALETVCDFLIADREHCEHLGRADHVLAKIGCLLAVGPSSPELLALFDEALADGFDPEILDVVLVHAVGHLGVIAARRAGETLAVSLKCAGKKADSLQVIEPDRKTREQNGARLLDHFDPGRQAEQAKKLELLSPKYHSRAMELSGVVLQSPRLALRERQIVTVAILACLGGQNEQLKFHMGVALRNGVSKRAIAEILILVQAYAGMPRANTAATLAVEAIHAH